MMDFFEKMKFSIIIPGMITQSTQSTACWRSGRRPQGVAALVSGPVRMPWVVLSMPGTIMESVIFFSKVHHFPHFTACFGDAAPDGSEALLWSNVYGGAGYGP